jgi:hypothetical protein
MAVWATVEDVQDLLRQDVTEEQLAVAQVLVEIEAGTTADFADGVISSANAEKLTRAVCFQAVWVKAHPDILERMDVKGVSQDGLSADYAAQNAMYMSPLANRLIRRLSWKLAPLRARVGRRRALGALDNMGPGDRDSAERDDSFVWAPLGSQGQRLGERGQVWR